MTADEPTPTDEAPVTDAPEAPAARPNDLASMEKALAKANKEAADARAALKALKPLADRAKELEDASKTELEKLTEQLATAKAEAAEALSARQRLDLALEKAPAGLGIEDVRWVANRAQGATPEELEADLVDLFARFAPNPTTTPPANGARQPIEALRPGALPSTPAPTLHDQIAAAEQAKDWKTALVLKSQLTQQLRETTNQ